MTGRSVKHKSFGIGTVDSIVENRITVSFGETQKQFSFPQAFISGFLATDDSELQIAVAQAIEAKQEQERLAKELKEKQKAEEEQQRIFAQRINNKTTGVRRPNVGKINTGAGTERFAQTDLESIAFKCNFCDGGSGASCIGFKGICSDDVISNNIEKQKHVWCSTGSMCKRYLNGEISRTELDAWIDPSGQYETCYESSLLKSWRMHAGVYQNGENAGKPMHMNRIHKGSLAVMTTRKPNTPEEERFIFAAYIVDDNYDGDDYEEGFVAANPKWRIEMAPGEAEQILFWNYYVNANKPEKITFGSGLHRYLTDIEAAQILRDIASVKNDAYSREFYEYFCSSNGIDPISLLQPNGALKRK